MFGTDAFIAVLSALNLIHASALTDDERLNAIAVVRDEFLSKDHDVRLRVIVDRITAPPVPTVEPDLEETLKSIRTNEYKLWEDEKAVVAAIEAKKKS